MELIKATIEYKNQDGEIETTEFDANDIEHAIDLLMLINGDICAEDLKP